MENNIEEIQAEVAEFVEGAEDLRNTLRHAESCETAADLLSNLEDALNTAHRITIEIRRLMARCPK